MELHELAVRYQILGLEEMTSHALNTLVITKDNMVFTATIAQKYKNTEFEDTCRKLQMKWWCCSSPPANQGKLS